MAKGKRKGLSKTTRFEVFKRDSFTCTYCGRTPPTVVLEVDHITAVANGGMDEMINLITSCLDCNRGKGARPLEQVPEALHDQIEKEKERRTQVEQYNAFLEAMRDADAKDIHEIGVYWYNRFCPVDRFCFGAGRKPTIKRFLKHLPKAQLKDFIDLAMQRVGAEYIERKGDVIDDSAYRYFCACCWKQIKGQGA